MKLKKIIALAFCAVLACSVLVGCGSKSEVSTAPAYVEGTRTETTFTSAWMGLTYTLPEDMKMETEEQMAQMKKVDGVVYEAVASNSHGSSIVIMTEKLNSSSVDEKIYLDASKKQLEKTKNVEITFEEPGKQTIAEQEFMTLPYTAVVTNNNDASKKSVNQIALYKKHGDRMICITVTYPDQAEYDRILTGFSKSA